VPPAGNQVGPNTAVAVQEGISEAVAKVRPAVVAITSQPDFNQPVDGTGVALVHPFNSGNGMVGSGLIVDPSGYILTSYQSVGRANQVNVTLFAANRREMAADVLAIDTETDLALLKLRSAETFPAAILGNSDSLEVGDIVFAVGSPFGFSRSVTMGIVSANRRPLEIDGIRYPEMIQTDAAINDGDDGGPLINIRGEVVGITMAYLVPGHHFSGIGFAVPINDAANILAARR